MHENHEPHQDVSALCDKVLNTKKRRTDEAISSQIMSIKANSDDQTFPTQLSAPGAQPKHKDKGFYLSLLPFFFMNMDNMLV